MHSIDSSHVEVDWSMRLYLHAYSHMFSLSLFLPHQVAQLGEKKFENPQTANLHHILVDCLSIHELMVEREREEVEEGEGEERRRRRTKGKLVSC